VFALVASAAPHHDAGAATRAVALSKSAELRNEVITVSWSGFHPTSAIGQYQVEVLECTHAPNNVDPSQNECDYAQPYPDSAGGNLVQTGTTDASGNGSATFEVRTSAQPLGALTCNFDNPCSIVVYELDFTNIPTNALPATAVVVPITFAATPKDCSGNGHFDVRGEGEWSSAEQMYAWAGQMCTGANSVSVDYTATSSNAGRASWFDPTNQLDVAVTSLPATSTEMATGEPHLPYGYAPVDLNAVVVGFTIDDAVTLAPITDITLTPRLVARLMTNSHLDTFFQDPEFVALNPGHSWPVAAVPPLVRADLNADTRLFTSWMIHDANAQKFVAGNDIHGVTVTSAYKDYPYPVDNFENAAGDTFNPLTNNDFVANYAFRARPALDNVFIRPWVGGYFAMLDRPTAARFGLPLAKLVNATGTAVAPDDAGLLAGYQSMTTDANGMRTPNFDATDASAYPLVKVDYALTPLQGADYDVGNRRFVADDAKTAHLKTFLDYVATSGQQTTNLLPGFVAMPAELVAQTQALAAQIGHFSGPATTTTTSTAPSTSTTSTTFTSYDTSGSSSCCSSSDPGSVGGGDPTNTSGSTPRGSAEPPRTATTTPTPRGSPSAPSWLPIASMTASQSGIGLLALFAAGLAALFARLGWLMVARAVASRATGSAPKGSVSGGGVTP
jgi:hypothetical protein